MYFVNSFDDLFFEIEGRLYVSYLNTGDFILSKTAIVTGAGSGMGQSTALRLADEAAELVTFLLTSKADYINGENIRIDGIFTSTK